MTETLSDINRIQNELRCLIVQLFDDLIKVQNEEDLFYIRFHFSDQVSMQVVMAAMIKYLLPCKEKILKKDRSYFYSDAQVFSKMTSSICNKDYLKRFFSSKTLSKNNEEAIWSYHQEILKLVEMYSNVLKQ